MIAKCQGMGLTVDNKLGGNTTVSYKALSTSSASYKDRVSPTGTWQA